MDIAKLSTNLSTNKAQEGASISMLKKAKDMMEQQGAQLSEMLEAIPTAPAVNDGKSLDIRI